MGSPWSPGASNATFIPPRDPQASPVNAYRVADELPRAFARFTAYAQSYRNHSATTMKWHRDVYDMFIDFLGTVGVTTVESPSAPALIQEWISRARQRGLSPFTVQTYWRGLRSLFAFLERTDGFPNPFRLLESPAIPDTLPKALTEEECVRVLDAAHNTDWSDAFDRARAAAMIGMALYAGLRRSEILDLAFSDVNMEDGSIRVVHGKGRGGGKGRVTYAAPELQALLRTYVEERRRAQRASVEFFTSKRSGHASQRSPSSGSSSAFARRRACPFRCIACATPSSRCCYVATFRFMLSAISRGIGTSRRPSATRASSMPTSGSISPRSRSEAVA